MGGYDFLALTPPPARSALLRVRPTRASRNCGPRSYPEHLHRDHELLLVTGAGYRCCIGGAELAVDDGDALLVLPGDHHADAGPAGCTWTSLRFLVCQEAPHGSAVALLRGEAPPAARRLAGAAPHLAPLLDELARAATANGAAARAEAEALANALVWRLTGLLPRRWLHPLLDELLADADLAARLAALAAAEGFSRLSVPALARRLAMSASALAHHCTRRYGFGPARLLLELRLAQARRLLAAGAGVGEAAAATGFADPSHFARAYRRWSGWSPSQEPASAPARSSTRTSLR